MPLVIDDEVLKKAGLSEQEARVELAVRLFEIGRLELWPAAQVAGMPKMDFVFELGSRGIDALRYGVDELNKDIETLDRLFGSGPGNRQ
jgi:predicted HTH domain antitoxin